MSDTALRGPTRNWTSRAGLAVLAVLLLALPLAINDYVQYVVNTILIYCLVSAGFNILLGYVGQLAFSNATFFGVGAYTTAICMSRFGLPFLAALAAAAAVGAVVGGLVGLPALRVRRYALAIVTLAFGEIIRVVITNWVSLTNGPNGISGIPRPTLFGLDFNMSGDPDTFAGFFGLEPSPTQRVAFLYYVIFALALLTNWVTLRLRRLPLGRAWEALREDEVACRSLGINVTTTKLTAFAIGAMFGGFAGAFFATRQAFVSPESFTFIESAIVLAIVVLGGLGSQLGVALAALIMIGGFEVFHQLQDYRMLVFGLALVLIMVLRPRGLVSGRTPSVALGKQQEIDPEYVAEGRG